MAHELEMVNGEASMAYAGETPWHGLGVKVESDISTDDMMVAAGLDSVSYTHLRAHETSLHLVCRLRLEKIFFNDTATTEIYTLHIVGSVRCV